MNLSESTKTEGIFRSRNEDTIAHYHNTKCSVDLDLGRRETEIDFASSMKNVEV